MALIDFDAEVSRCERLIDQAEYEIASMRKYCRESELADNDNYFEWQLTAARAATQLENLRSNPWGLIADRPVSRMGDRVESAVSSDGTVEITGYASVTNRAYPVFDDGRWFTEVVERGAFAETLAAGAEVDLLIDHARPVLATTADGSLTLEEDRIGLKFRAVIDAARHDVAALLRAAGQCSFTFNPVEACFDAASQVRTVKRADLDGLDVTLTGSPCNPHTSVGLTGAEADERRLAYLESQLADYERYGPA